MERATVEVYEQHAQRWLETRPARFVDEALALGHAVVPGGLRVDLGCGAGEHLRYLGRPVVALDAARAMLLLARTVASDARCVQADLEALPFRPGSLDGSWARASYLHVRRDRLPWALAQLHQTLRLDAPGAFTLRHGTQEGTIADDEFPGRFFAEWEAEPLRDVFVGAGFRVDEMIHDPGSSGGEWIQVRTTRARTLPDLVGPGMRVLVCGLNPSVYAADRGVGFARPGNRFWPAALAAGLVTRDRDPADALRRHGVGMTDLVKRATPKANELGTEEYRQGAARVERLVTWLQPRVVCFVGLTGWRAAVDPHAVAGLQPSAFGGAAAYVMPNTSGVNAHVTLDGVIAHIARVLALAE
jgi:double-stranded uracil-DNA glycosylase